jgi:amphi-Trp domain-containing protein
MPTKRGRDIEKACSTREFVAKLRRFADALESGRAFVIHVAGERLYVPPGAHCSIEHERAGKTDEVEFQVRWQRE